MCDGYVGWWAVHDPVYTGTPAMMPADCTICLVCVWTPLIQGYGRLTIALQNLHFPSTEEIKKAEAYPLGVHKYCA
jgi:hypothetical protein